MESTVQKAFSVLEKLAHSAEPRRLTDIAKELSLTKPNAYRLLATLSELGYVRKDADTSRYSATLKLRELGSQFIVEADLEAAARPELAKLCERCGESVQMCILDDGFAVYVEKVDSPQPVKAIAVLGSRFPATATSSGKAMLAWLPQEALDEAMKHVKRFTPLTLVKRRDIEKDLEEIRKRGYSINRGEYRKGICGIGCPIRNSTGRVVAGVGVWGLAANILGPRRDELARQVMDAAAQISKRLGYTRSSAS